MYVGYYISYFKLTFSPSSLLHSSLHCGVLIWSASLANAQNLRVMQADSVLVPARFAIQYILVQTASCLACHHLVPHTLYPSSVCSDRLCIPSSRSHPHQRQYYPFTPTLPSFYITLFCG
ncbi:hypothetical protein H4582DRAFT_1955096, partial [Lactarius indigo]